MGGGSGRRASNEWWAVSRGTPVNREVSEGVYLGWVGQGCLGWYGCYIEFLGMYSHIGGLPSRVISKLLSLDFPLLGEIPGSGVFSYL